MKSVTFGKNVVHEIENISDYIRNQTFHVILDMAQIRISMMIKMSNKKVHISERLLVIENSMLPITTMLAKNRDVLFLNMKIKGSESDFTRSQRDYKSCILFDFIETMISSFSHHKYVNVSYGHDRTIMEFDVSPFPSLELDITSI